MNEPRTYRHSPLLFVILLIVFIIAAAAVFPLLFTGQAFFLLIPAAFLGAILLFGLYFLTSATVVSDTEIASRRLWGTHALRWTEIHEVSGSRSGIKLKNFDGDVTVLLNSQLPGYEQVIEELARKRADLFASPEFSVLETSRLLNFLQILFALAFLGFAGWIFIQNESGIWLPALMFAAMALFVLWSGLSTVQSVTMEGSTIVLRYLNKEVTYRADEIQAVTLDFQRTRNGRIYFVRLALKNGRSVRLTNLQVGAAFAYLVIREWHRKQAGKDYSV